MDILAIQHSLANLENRYRQFSEIWQKQREDWETEETRLQENLAVLRGEKQSLVRELREVREEKEALQRQLYQVQEEFEQYFLQSSKLLDEGHRKDEKLNWLRGQRHLLLRMLRLQGRLQQRFISLDARIAFPTFPRRAIPWWRSFLPS